MPGERLVGRAKGESGVSNNRGGKREREREVLSSPACGGKGVVKYRGAPEKGEKGAPLCVREAASSTQNLAIVISVRI